MTDSLESLIESLEPGIREKIKEKIKQEYRTPHVGIVCNSLLTHVAVLDPYGDIIKVNRAWEEFANINNAPTDYTGWNYIDICEKAKGEYSEGAFEAASGLREVLDGKEKNFSFEYYCPEHTKDGLIPRWFVMRAVPFREDPSYIIVSHDDITQRKLVEEKIKKSNDWFKALFENTGSATIVSEEDTTIHMINSRFEELFGYKKEDVENKKSWTQLVVPEYLDTLKKNHYLRRKDESLAPENYECQMITANKEKKDVLNSAKMIPNSKRSIITIIDITEKKQNERFRDEAERIVKHDLKTPLNGIKGMANLLTMTELNSEQKEYVDFIIDSTDSMSENINRSLDIVKMQKGEYKPDKEIIDIDGLLRDMPTKFNEYIENGYSFNYRFTPDDSMTRILYGEKRLLQNLLENLIKNGFEADQKNGEGGVDITVTRKEDFKIIDIYNKTSVPGPAAENFFGKYNSYGKTNGTGLGTYSAYLIAKAHNGNIDFSSDKDGTHVYLTLPCKKG